MTTAAVPVRTPPSDVQNDERSAVIRKPFSGRLVLGGLGVSGDTSRVRNLIGLDFVPGGVGPDNTDNLIIVPDVTPNTFEHPDCGGDVADIIADLATSSPIGD